MLKTTTWTSRFILLLALSSLGLNPAHAGGSREGHGGDAVVCRAADGALESAELLDYFEARRIEGLRIDLPGDSFVARVETALNRLAKFDSDYAHRLWGHFKRFLRSGSVAFPPRAEIPEIDDATSSVALAPGCVSMQLAVQKPENENAPLLYVDQEIWAKIDVEGRAGLFLHEIVYRDEIAFGADDSDGVRKFVSLLSSDRFEKLTPSEYEAAASRLLLSGGN